jgi:hypothetical protein
MQCPKQYSADAALHSCLVDAHRTLKNPEERDSKKHSLIECQCQGGGEERKLFSEKTEKTWRKRTRKLLLESEEEEITAFHPHQADKTT